MMVRSAGALLLVGTLLVAGEAQAGRFWTAGRGQTSASKWRGGPLGRRVAVGATALGMTAFLLISGYGLRAAPPVVVSTQTVGTQQVELVKAPRESALLGERWMVYATGPNGHREEIVNIGSQPLNLRFTDVTGDGRADLVYDTPSGAVFYHPAEGGSGHFSIFNHYGGSSK